MWRIRRLIRIAIWLWEGCPMIRYERFRCGACGKGYHIPFCVPTFDSLGGWWDTWSVCPKGEGCSKEV